MAVISSETRPWGKFEVFADEAHMKLKRLVVAPGKRLSYQSHKQRSEHWVVVKGTATVTIDDTTREYKYGDYIHVAQGAKHRLANLGSEMVEVIEVQIGTYFGEDDIVRYHDDHGRV